MGGGLFFCLKPNWRMSTQSTTRLRANRDANLPSPWLVRLAGMRAWLFLMLLLIVFETWSRVSYGTSFVLSSYNAQSIAVFAVAPLLLALGETFVIIAGGIDLSVGFIMGLSSVVAAHATNLAGTASPPFVAMLAGVMAGIAVALIPGGVNGWLISKLKVPPFIGTLGMFGVARGVAFLLANGTTVPVANDWFAALGNGRFNRLSRRRRHHGPVRAHHALPAEPDTVRPAHLRGRRQRAGGPAGRHRGRPPYAQALPAVGRLRRPRRRALRGRFTAGAAQAGEPLLLDSIAAVVIGGASLFGGSGTILGTVAGSLVIAVIQYGLVFIDVEPFWQFVAVGVVIIISVLVDQTQRKLGGER